MVAVAGPPPRDFIQRSETTEQCFDPNGKHQLLKFVLGVASELTRDNTGTWIANDDAAVPSVSLESLEKRLVGREKELFIQFMRSMLKWLPEERKTAKELLDDPWLL